MNCSDFEARLREAIERGVTPDGARALDAHVEACPRCAALRREAFQIACREIVELYDFIENTLPAERRAVFLHHFRICDACRNYLASYRSTIELARRVCAPQGLAAATPLPDELARSILRHREGE